MCSPVSFICFPSVFPECVLIECLLRSCGRSAVEILSLLPPPPLLSASTCITQTDRLHRAAKLFFTLLACKNSHSYVYFYRNICMCVNCMSARETPNPKMLGHCVKHKGKQNATICKYVCTVFSCMQSRQDMSKLIILLYFENIHSF